VAIPGHRFNRRGTVLKTIPVGLRHLALVDDGDYELVSQFKWSLNWDSKRRVAYAFRYIRRDGKVTTQFMHTLIMSPCIEIDHKNRDGLDNRRENLRDANHSNNHANQPKQRGNYSSEFKGVSWNKKRKIWKAQIGLQNRAVFLGYFPDELAAAIAYDRAAIKYFGEYAHTNLPKENYK
jgi:hypothetical protein